MKTFGPVYAGVLDYPSKDILPKLEVGTTQETEMPYRRGKCLVFKVPFTVHGVFLGILRKAVKDPTLLTDEDIDLLMLNALKGRKAWSPSDGSYNEFF